MTRINLIPVNELTDQHLLAEHREIKRIPNVILSGRYNLDWQPSEFCLWTWHVKFFYDKLLFLRKRYLHLYEECLKRNFKVEWYWRSFLWLDMNLYNDYIPTQEAIELSRARIEEKIKAKPWYYKYYWKPYWIQKGKLLLITNI